MGYFEKMKMDTSTYITIIGSFVAAIILAAFGLWAGRIQKKESDADKQELQDTINRKNAELILKSDEIVRITKENSEEIVRLTKENAAEQKKRDQEQIIEAQEQAVFAKKAYEENRENSETIQKLQADQIKKAEEIVNLSTKLADLSTETLNSVIGKDSYSYLKIVVLQDPTTHNYIKNSAEVYLFHDGKYILRNLKISIVNTDEEADEESHSITDYTEDPVKFHRANNPYVENVSLLVPNQHLRLNDLDIYPRKQKSFHIFFAADNGFWFQRVLLRDAYEFGALKDQKIDHFIGKTFVYKLDLDPKLNQVHRYEILKKMGPTGSRFGYRPELIKFNDGKEDYFPEYKWTNWYFLHWNGNYLEKGHISLPSGNEKVNTDLRNF